MLQVPSMTVFMVTQYYGDRKAHIALPGFSRDKSRGPQNQDARAQQCLHFQS